MENTSTIQYDNWLTPSPRVLRRASFGWVFFLALMAHSPAVANLRIVTTTADLASLTRSIGKEKVSVESIVRGIQDPHFIEAKPSYFVLLSRADLVIAVGLELESGWLPLALRGARRPNLLPGNKGFLDTSEAITPIEVDLHADRSKGDIHPQGNPHYLGDPSRSIAVAALIARKLTELDPANGAFFQANFDAYKSSFQKQLLQWKKQLPRGVKVIGYHKTLNYFFDYFGMIPIGYIEPKPGVPPSAQHSLSLIQTGKKEGVKLVIIESFFDPKPAENIAAATGAKLLTVPAYTGGNEESQTYQDWVEFLVTSIEKALR